MPNVNVASVLKVCAGSEIVAAKHRARLVIQANDAEVVAGKPHRIFAALLPLIEFRYFIATPPPSIHTCAKPERNGPKPNDYFQPAAGAPD